MTLPAEDTTTNPLYLGDAILRMRLAAGWSQSQLAELTGVSFSRVRRIEHGKPGLATDLMAFAAVFDVPPESLRALPPGRTEGRKRINKPGKDIEPGALGAWTWHSLPWEEDSWAQKFVQDHPDGASCEEIAEVFGRSHEWVRYVCEGALKKLRQEVPHSLVR